MRVYFQVFLEHAHLSFLTTCSSFVKMVNAIMQPIPNAQNPVLMPHFLLFLTLFILAKKTTPWDVRVVAAQSSSTSAEWFSSKL